MENEIFQQALNRVLKKKRLGRCDFHTHTFLSDGELLPMELIRRCEVKGYSVVAVTDHVSHSNYEFVIDSLIKDCEVACKEMGILALPGVELTHVPPRRIKGLAKVCKEAGAAIVVVHGETLIEPVAKGTNGAACGCKDVNILAHPGLITKADCNAAKKNGVFLEITSRKGHGLSNGHVLLTGRSAGCKFLINSDAHSPTDLMDQEFAEEVGSGSGMGLKDLKTALSWNPVDLLERIGKS